MFSNADIFFFPSFCARERSGMVGMLSSWGTTRVKPQPHTFQCPQNRVYAFHSMINPYNQAVIRHKARAPTVLRAFGGRGSTKENKASPFFLPSLAI